MKTTDLDGMASLETRKSKMDHMFALMEEVRVLVGRLGEHSDIEPTIRQLNYRVEELKRDLTLNQYEREGEKDMFNINRGDPLKEGTE